MHRYSHYIYIYTYIYKDIKIYTYTYIYMTHKQNGLLCCKPPEIFPEGLIPPVVTSGQARHLRRHCLVPCASSFPRVQASKLPCADGSASAMWPCCIWSLLHVEPLHICDLPAATASKSCLVFFAFSPISCRPRLRSNLPLLLPHMHAGIAPLLRLYILSLYVYCRSPKQWPASETLLSFRAAGRTLRWRRRAWDGAPTSAPESLALLHARSAAPSHKATGAGAVAASNRHRMNHDSLGLVFL